MLAFLAAFHLVAFVDAQVQATESDTAPLPREHLVQAAYARQYPCPRIVPAAWRRSDSTQASGWRCSMLVASERALRGRTSPAWFRVEDAQCARLIPMRYKVLGKRHARRAGYWTVEFFLPNGHGVRAVIDMNAGKLHTELLPNEFGYSMDQLCRVAH